MKSIQTKFIVLILGCLFFSSSVIGGAGIMYAKNAADEESAKTMNLLCEERALEINALLSRIQQSVGTLAAYAAGQLESVKRLKNDPLYLTQYTKLLEPVAVNAACNTEGAMAVYVRFNPEFTPPTSGLFWSKTAQDGNFRQLTPTDFSGFNPADAERVGWYYIPVKNGKPTWMTPYFNKNINVRMISFVIPLYMSNQTVGVVGMDIDFSVITGIVNGIEMYRDGYAFLMGAASTVMYHKSIEFGTSLASAEGTLRPVVAEMRNGTSGSSLVAYTWRGDEKRMAFRTLNNGMLLAVTALISEIDAVKDRLIFQVCIALLIIAGLSIFITVLMTRRLIRPLRELNEAAKKIASGDLSISLTHQTKDEVGMLADSFQQTVTHLQTYINYINGLAYRDALTGVKNKTAYQDAEGRLEEQMRCGRPEFAVVMLDINGLKEVNDTYGHDFGDMLIINVCRIICKAFQHSPVYRIGGDEFVVILENADYKHYPELLKKLQAAIEEYNRDVGHDTRVSIARGIAVYDSEIDLVFANVFKRADDAMYQNKAAMKAKAVQREQEEAQE